MSNNVLQEEGEMTNANDEDTKIPKRLQDMKKTLCKDVQSFPGVKRFLSLFFSLFD